MTEIPPHEAAHTLAHVRGVKDTSSGHRNLYPRRVPVTFLGAGTASGDADVSGPGPSLPDRTFQALSRRESLDAIKETIRRWTT